MGGGLEGGRGGRGQNFHLKPLEYKTLVDNSPRIVLLLIDDQGSRNEQVLRGAISAHWHTYIHTDGQNDL